MDNTTDALSTPVGLSSMSGWVLGRLSFIPNTWRRSPCGSGRTSGGGVSTRSCDHRFGAGPTIVQRTRRSARAVGTMAKHTKGAEAGARRSTPTLAAQKVCSKQVDFLKPVGSPVVQEPAPIGKLCHLTAGNLPSDQTALLPQYLLGSVRHTHVAHRQLSEYVSSVITTASGRCTIP
jgi:hypothetical protein